MEEDKKAKESLLTKKEWIEYIDKLINRASANINRSGLTIWAIIAALAVLIIRIVDIYYSQIVIDIDILFNLYCCFALFLVLLLIIIVIIRNLSNSRISFLSSYIEENRNRFFVLFISNIVILLVFISSSQYKLLYTLLSILLMQCLQVNNPWLLSEGYYKLQSIISFKLYILSLKYKLLLFLLSLALCLFLITDNLIRIDFKSIPKEILLFSLYSFASICLLSILIYTLTGGYELKQLKYIENLIISEEIDDIKTIKKYFNLFIIGLSIKDEINAGFEYLKGIAAENGKLSDELVEKYKELLEDPEKETLESINQIYELTNKWKNNSRYYYCILLNKKAILILKKESSELKKDLDEIIRSWRKTQRKLNRMIKMVNNRKEFLKKNQNGKDNKSRGINGGMVK